MSSSLSLLLGGTPTTFQLHLEFQSKCDAAKVATVEVPWGGSEKWDTLKEKLQASFRDFHASPFCEQCRLKLNVVGDAVAVELDFQTEQPILQSLTFSRAAGGAACDERYVKEAFADLDLTSATRLRCREGFPFFVPGLVPSHQWCSLRQLHLVNAGLMGLPGKLGEYTQLQELRLSHNRLTTLPRELGNLTLLQVLVADHNQILTVPADLCDCSNLQDLNLEFNSIAAMVLDLSRFPKLHSLQLCGNPLSYFPVLSVCHELRSLSLVNLRVWSDVSYSQFEVGIDGTTELECGTKLNPLFSVLFSRSSSQHPLLAGALGRLAEYRRNADAMLEQPGAPLQQLILMVLSPQSVVQAQAAKVIGLMVQDVATTKSLIRNGIVDALCTVLDSTRQESRMYALKALSAMARTSDAMAVELLVPKLLKKFVSFTGLDVDTVVRHTALETIGNLSFAVENKRTLLSEDGLKDALKKLTLDPVDRQTQLLACRCLAVLGENEVLDAIVGRPSIRGRGVRILSIDGGGMKGLAAVKMLQELERRTGHRISDLFDLIGGTSTGAMLAVALGILQFPLEQCDEIYKKLGYLVFNQAQEQQESTGWKDTLGRMYRSGQQGLRVMIAGCKHNASTFEALLQEMCSPLKDKGCGSLYIDSAVLPGPRVFAASTLTSTSPPVPFLFRNYEPPLSEGIPRFGVSDSLGGCKYDVWQGVRASSAAPYFFEDFKLGDLHFQDGAMTANNPTALAVQQAKLLWPGKPIDCVVSIGLGAVPTAPREKSSSSLIENGNVLIESSCSVERTHEVMSLMSTMLPEMQYFRFNPVDSRCNMALDELDSEKWGNLEAATLEYIRKNQSHFNRAAEILMTRDDVTAPAAALSNGVVWREQRSMLVLRAVPGEVSGVREGLNPLHFMDYAAGTVDVCREQLAPNSGCKRQFQLTSVKAASASSRMEFLQSFSRQIHGQCGALHLEMASVEDGNALVLNWKSSMWSITDPSIQGPEAEALKMALGVDSSVPLNEALEDRRSFVYLRSQCRFVSHQQLFLPTPCSLYLFIRTEPSEIFPTEEISTLHFLIQNAIVTCPSFLSESFIQTLLHSGALAVLSCQQDPPPPSEAICFFKHFYDALYSGQISHTAFLHVQSLMPHLKSVYQLS